MQRVRESDQIPETNIVIEHGNARRVELYRCVTGTAFMLEEDGPTGDPPDLWLYVCSDRSEQTVLCMNISKRELEHLVWDRTVVLVPNLRVLVGG